MITGTLSASLPTTMRLETPTGGGVGPDSGVIPPAWGMREAMVSTITLAPRLAAVLLR